MRHINKKHPSVWRLYKKYIDMQTFVINYCNNMSNKNTCMKSVVTFSIYPAYRHIKGALGNSIDV